MSAQYKWNIGLYMDRLVLNLAVVLLVGAQNAAAQDAPGAILAWGDNGSQQCDVPVPNEGFVSVAGGGYHSLGLKADGSIVAWGYNGSGQGNVPAPNSGFVAVAAGDSHSLGLKADGSIVAWGTNGYGQCDVPPVDPNNPFVAVAGGYIHTLGLKADGSIVAWGYNQDGQCDVPAPNSGFVAVAAGGYHSLGLKADGSIVAWGDNGNGQCNVPALNRGFVGVAAGGAHSLGLKADGSIVAWGHNYAGQCNVPGSNTGFVAVAGGEVHSLGLKADGSIVAWGSDYYGQCNPPLQNSGFVAIAAGRYHSLGLKAPGPGVAWGYNQDGQCDVPAPNSGFVAVAAGGYHSMGLKADGSIVAWGDNGNGQCNVPVPNSAFVAVAGGREYSLGLKGDGSIVAWGSNWAGQCDVPAVDPNNPFVGVASGWMHSLGLKSDGSVVGWGANDFGQCNVPAPNNGFVAVAAGAYHSLGLKSDGSIVAWGWNDDGQCNAPAPNNGFVAVVGGTNHSLGLKADGSIAAWGSNDDGQCNVPAPNNGFIAVAAGWYHSLGLKADGSIVAWGRNNSGQCNVPAPNRGFVGVFAGSAHSLAVSVARRFFVAGDFQGWDPAADPLAETPPAGSGLWSRSYSGLTPGSRHEWKVTDGTWDFTVPADPNTNSWLYADPNGVFSVTYDTNSYTDGWQPATDRLGLAFEPGTWTATGSFLHLLGGVDWDNDDPLGAMVAQGGGIYLLEIPELPPSDPNDDYAWKAVVTGTWDAISSDGRSTDAAEWSFQVAEPGGLVRLWVDALHGCAKLEIVPLGACCFLDGSCQVLTETACLGLMGNYQGDGTDCDPNPCPQVGACCFLAGTCQVLTEDDCLGVAGSYQGDGTDCKPNPCPKPPGSWHFETIDSLGYVGRFPSLAVDADGIPHVAYWDDMTVRVKYAKRVGDAWQVEFISEFQGSYPSLALDAQGRPHISWNKAVFGSPVMYTYWDGAQWITQQLPSEVHRGHNNRSSLALTAGGLPRLAVMPTGSETFTYGLDYLAWDGSAWSRVQLVSGGTQAGVPALALDPNDNPRIVWHILWSSGAEFLKCFWSDGAGWSSETITTAIENLTLFDRASLAIDASGTPHTVFTSTSGPLMHARRTASGWEFEQIGAYPPLPSESSIALDAYDDPHVAVGHWSVRYAHRALAPWTVETVVSSPGAENTPCIAVGPNGYPHIAWWDSVGNDLEYAWWEPLLPGACCDPQTGACSLETEPDCLAGGGVFQGIGIDCDPNPCPQPTGACCFDYGACQVLTAAECGTAGGIYQGDQTVCAPNPCLEPITIETVTVGNPGNAGYWGGPAGAVDYVYKIGKYEVTAAQYTAFLNAVAATDTYELYNTLMWSDGQGCKIERRGSAGSYTYFMEPDWANRPVNLVSWGDAARFANWLHNGQPTGLQDLSTTENGSYFLNGATTYEVLAAVVREADATWVIPNFSEWHKAAYHKNDGVTGNYFDYPTSSDAVPSNQLIDPDPGNNATFYAGGFTIGSPYWRTEVGAHENSDSPYGTFDQGGNVWEWNDGLASPGDRSIRGGSWSGESQYLSAWGGAWLTRATDMFVDLGFRVAQVPTGACCFADGSCQVLSSPACADAGGSFQGDGTDCDPNPCPQPGACCRTDGSCTIETLIGGESCENSGGVYQGDGSDCDPNPCPPPTGACCQTDGSCAETTEAACTGAWQGALTTCTPNLCPPAGACCFPDKSCQFLTDVACTQAGGTWQGTGTDCQPNPCRDPGDDCEHPLVIPGIPYADVNTTCGHGDDYHAPFGQEWSGEDIVYQLTLAESACVRIRVTGSTGSCGLTLEQTFCGLSSSGGSCDRPSEFLQAGTHYLRIDSDPPPDCIDEFTLTIEYATTGACCFMDSCVGDLTEAECLAGGGTWQECASCAGGYVCPPPQGACCYMGNCLGVMPYQQCCAQLGEWFEGETCATVTCPTPTVAACCVNGVCIGDLPREMCLVQSGRWMEGESCYTGFTCPPGSGVCCLPDGSCVDNTAESACCGMGGTWSPASSCAEPDACPTTTAACCVNGACAGDQREGECLWAGGQWYPGQSCADPAPPCPPAGACCFADGSCAQLAEFDCLTVPAASWIAATPCTPNPCVSPLGDCDGDHRVDFDDFEIFSACMAGPEFGVAPECSCADLDGDGDADLADFAELQRLFTVP